MKTNLVLQSFGRENEYRRAILTILSYYAHTTLPINETRVILFTDNPYFFTSYVKGLPIEYVLLTAEKIKEMRGQYDFLHRMKIAEIDEAFGMVDGNMLYADSDTFFIADPTHYMSKLSEKNAFMHLHEFKFEDVRNAPLPAGQTIREFINLIESKEFILSDGSLIKVNTQHSSWNAGVMMFHPDHQKFIKDVYKLTDQFFPPTQNHASEQFAFSIILQNNVKLKSCDDVIYHYWYRTKKQIIDDFLLKNCSTKLQGNLENKLTTIKTWTQMLERYLEAHVWTLRDNAIQKFNEKNYKDGYKWAAKALAKGILKDTTFLKDIAFHTREYIFKKQR